MRRREITAALTLPGLLLSAPHGRAQEPWPDRAIRIVVPVAAGGIIDQLARVLAEALSPALGQPVVIDQRPGADHLIGIEAVLRSPADGHAWLAAATPLTVNPVLRRSVPYNLLRDFTGAALIATSANFVVVPPDVPASTLAELVALARARPGAMNYGNAGNGSSSFLATELFKMTAGIEVTAVPYRGQPPAVADLLTGRLQMMLLTAALAVPLVREGKLRALAVVAPNRSALLPDVPTMAEAGLPQVDVIPWFGFVLRAATPAPVLARINAEVNAALRQPAVMGRMARIGADPYPPSTQEDFGRLLRAELARWPTVIAAAGLQPEP